MPSNLEIVVQSTEEVEQTIRFRTYLIYLEKISAFLEQCDGDEKKVISRVTQSNSFKSIATNAKANKHKIGQLLRNAWLTEVQLNLTFGGNVSYSNHWAPVQVYYATYLSIRAFFLAMGVTVSHEHASTLKYISQEIVRRPDLFPRPWKVVGVGDPKSGSVELKHLPNDVSIKRASTLSTGVDTWDSYHKFIKTTRDRQLRKACDDWKRTNKKKVIREANRQAVLGNLAPTSLFNALYRLRIRSNYEDADSFLMSIQETDEAIRFNSALKKVGWYTLFALETLIARYLSRSEYEKIVLEFRRHETGNHSEQLVGKRLEVIKTAW